ncbi:MAG: Chemotaxis phosphatase CheX [Pseudomonadota bacterium]|jgi:hypothetical protein
MMITAQELEVELHRVMHEVVLSLSGDTTAITDATTGARSEQRLGCRVAIHGPFEGHVAVLATFGVAAQFAVRMFGADLSGAPSLLDAQEALREVANIVAGNLKPLFGEHNTLGLPEDLPSDLHLSNRGQLAEATAAPLGGALEVRVYTLL